MISDTVANFDSTISTKTIVESIEVKITKCIFPWQTSPAEHYPEIGTECHCLLRIYHFEKENRAVILASSLWSNHDNCGIWSDLNCFAGAIVDRFPDLKPIISNLNWITHSGQFSYELTWAETLHRDRFREFSVSISDENRIDVDELLILKQVEVRELINKMPLEAATEVLKQLGHDNGWGGVINDEQIKACRELENCIILGQERETGSVGW
jgi:hypothetical protein